MQATGKTEIALKPLRRAPKYVVVSLPKCAFTYVHAEEMMWRGGGGKAKKKRDKTGPSQQRQAHATCCPYTVRALRSQSKTLHNKNRTFIKCPTCTRNTRSMHAVLHVKHAKQAAHHILSLACQWKAYKEATGQRRQAIPVIDRPLAAVCRLPEGLWPKKHECRPGLGLDSCLPPAPSS